MKNKPIVFILLFLFFSSCTKVLHITGHKSSSVKIEDAAKIEESQAINDLIDPFKVQLEKEMKEVIGFCEEELVKEKPECTMGNWTADLIHKKCEDYYEKPIDFAVVNYGGLRIPFLPKGEITRATMFELMPFENMLVVLHADGKTVQDLFVRMAEYGGWPVSHQVRFKIADGKPIDIQIEGKSIQNDKIYKIAMSDFLADGGDQCPFFKDKKRDLLGKLFRDALIEQVQELNDQGKKVNAKKEGRVILAD